MLGLRTDIYWMFVTIFIQFQNLMMSECNVFKTNNNVTVDTGICLFHNFTAPASKWICMESCHNIPTCSGVVTTQGSPTYRCCLVTDSEIQYRKPGDMILYSKYAIPVKCQTGWRGDQCDSCQTGWTGERCDVCEFGFNATSNCTECIQYGKWSGTDGVQMIIYLTFDGPGCSNLAPGTPVAYNYNSDQGIVIGGNYDSTTGILTIMDDFGYNPRGEVELGTKTVIGVLAGPISVGAAVDLFYQG